MIMKRMNMKRNDYISWDAFFMGVAELAGKRSKDPSSGVGACIVKDKKILGVGYNGFPNGIPDDRNDKFPWVANEDFVLSKHAYVVHAELNAILNTGDKTHLIGSTIYCTLAPCNECVKAIIQSGITKVIIRDTWREKPYHEAAQRMLEHVGIEIEQYKGEQL